MIGNILTTVGIAVGFALSNPKVYYDKPLFDESLNLSYLNDADLYMNKDEGDSNFFVQCLLSDFSTIQYDLTNMNSGNPFDYISQVEYNDQIICGYVCIRVLGNGVPIQNNYAYLPFLNVQHFNYNNETWVVDGLECYYFDSVFSVYNAAGEILADSINDYDASFGIGFVQPISNQSFSYDGMQFSPFYFQVLSEGQNNGWGFQSRVICNFVQDTNFNYGYQFGYKDGESKGHKEGYQEGLATAEQGDFMSLFNSIADTPLRFLYGLFSFDLFGTSMIIIILTLLTAIVLFGVIKKFWK